MIAETGTDIGKAAQLLTDGKLVAIPTETVYGLAANAQDENAVASIFQAKNRPFFDPLIVHISSVSDVTKYADYFPAEAQVLAEHFWPGPLTLVLPKKNNIPDLVTAGNPSVGLRVPNHPLTLELLAKLPFPLAAPSANPFGYVSPTRPEHVKAQLGHVVPYILDGGPCQVGLESTIVSFSPGTAPKVLRLGGLEVSSIEKLIGPVDENLLQNSNPQAPGQLDLHYSPRCRILPETDLVKQLEEYKDLKVALLRFSSKVSFFDEHCQLVLATDGQLKTAATHLFAILRMLDEQGYQLAIAQEAPDMGLGRAINDRLKRAMAKA